jgi:glycosyltransferase involved in cell wall biosynthesis
VRIVIYHTFSVRTQGGPRREGGEGGGAIHLFRKASLWAEQGDDVRVVTNQPDVVTSLTTARVFSIDEEADSSIKSTLTLLPRVLAFIEKNVPGLGELRPEAIDDQNDTIVIAGTPNISDIVHAGRFSSLTGAPVVVFFHHLTPPPWWFPERRGGLVRCIAAWSVSQLALIITKICGYVPSVDQERILSSSGWRFPTPPLLDPLFVPTEFLEDSTISIQRDIDAVYIGRLGGSKGSTDLGRICELILTGAPTARIAIAGDYESAFFKRRFTRSISKFRSSLETAILGRVSPDVKKNLLDRSKVFLFPAYEEGWSLSVMEAAARGALPIVYDLPAFDYLGEGAVRIPPGNVEQFAAVTLSLLSDDSKRTQLAQIARARVSMYNGSNIARTQAQNFRHIIDSRRGQPNRI